LQQDGDFRSEFDPTVRKNDVAEGDTEGLDSTAQPVGASRLGPRHPLPEDPTAILLRKTTSNKTGPHCLPGSSVVVDNTPMGLLGTTLSSGVSRGTYYTAKKK